MPVRFLSSDEETKLQQSAEEYQPKFEAFGRPAPTPFAGEETTDFRRRALSKLQPLVPGFEDLKIDQYLREPNFKYVEQKIFEAAEREARQPTRIPEGELREVKKLDQSGRPFYEFHGRAGAWMSDFSSGAANRKVVGIRTETQKGFIGAMGNNIR